MNSFGYTLLIPYLYAVFNVNIATVSTSIPSYFNIQKSNTVTIGLLVDNQENGQDAILAAQLAINQANESRENNGKMFKLAYRVTDGPWGQASNKAVELIFEENSVAIVGALDGRTAHLVEQVTAKSHIPYIETHATDPTLSKAFVPWFFRLVPNDYQVSQAFVEDIYNQHKLSKVAIISDNTYDGKMASSAFKKVIAEQNTVIPTYFFLDDKDAEQTSIISRLKAENFHAIVLLLQSANQHPKLLGFLNQSKAYIYQNQIRKEQIQPLPGYSFQTVSVVTNSAKYKKFNVEFQKFTNSTPSTQASYIFDAINLVLQAISTTGTKPEIIGQYLGKMDVYDGVSGLIKFDNQGNLMRSTQLIPVK